MKTNEAKAGKATQDRRWTHEGFSALAACLGTTSSASEWAAPAGVLFCHTPKATGKHSKANTQKPAVQSRPISCCSSQGSSTYGKDKSAKNEPTLDKAYKRKTDEAWAVLVNQC